MDVHTAVFGTGTLYPQGEQSRGDKGGRGAGQGSTQFIHCFLKSDQVVCEETAVCAHHHLREIATANTNHSLAYSSHYCKISLWDSDQDLFVGQRSRSLCGTAIKISLWDSDQDLFVGQRSRFLCGTVIKISSWDSDQDLFVGQRSRSLCGTVIKISLWDSDQDLFVGQRSRSFCGTVFVMCCSIILIYHTSNSR